MKALLLTILTFCFTLAHAQVVNDCSSKKPEWLTLQYNDSIVGLTEAEFPGGEDALIHYIDSSVKAITFKPEVSQILYVSVTLSDTGTVLRNDLANKTKCLKCTMAAMFITQSMPTWKPARARYKDGSIRNEKFQVLIPVKFLK